MSKTNFTKKALRHGEVYVIPIDVLPEGLEVEAEGMDHVLGHSETGHHHVLTADAVLYRPISPAYNGTAYQAICESIWGERTDLYPDELVPFRARTDGKVVHKKTFDVHAPIDVLKGLYVKYTKRRFNYFSKLMERVRD